MTQFWRTSAVTGAGLFLETCAFYLIIRIIGAALHQPGATLPFWLVFLTILWAFFLSMYVQILKYTPNLRGLAGLGVSVVSLLGLSHLKTGLGLIPIGAFFDAGLETALRQVMIFAFLVLLWWRGSTIAHDDVTLDTVRSSFQWGLVALFAAVLVDAIGSAGIVSGFLVMGFFGVGLAGLSLARFSSESSDTQVMTRDWWLPISVSVGAVLVLGLLISAAGLGGLDDVTRAALKLVGTIGFWVLKPVFLALGYVAGLLVALGNWVSSMFGGGDLSGLERAQEQLRLFHENMQKEAGDGGLPPLIGSLARWLGFLAGVTLASWVLYRIFRFRRLMRGPGAVEETRESLFSWARANEDLSSLLSDWLGKLMPAGGGGRRRSMPRNPREFYHALLALAAESGRSREDWQTPKEHEGTLLGLLPMEPVDRIVDGFQSAYYGDSPAADQEIDRLGRDWAAIQEFADEQNRLLNQTESEGQGN